MGPPYNCKVTDNAPDQDNVDSQAVENDGAFVGVTGKQFIFSFWRYNSFLESDNSGVKDIKIMHDTNVSSFAGAMIPIEKAAATNLPDPTTKKPEIQPTNTAVPSFSVTSNMNGIMLIHGLVSICMVHLLSLTLLVLWFLMLEIFISFAYSWILHVVAVKSQTEYGFSLVKFIRWC